MFKLYIVYGFFYISFIEVYVYFFYDTYLFSCKYISVFYTRELFEGLVYYFGYSILK